MDRLPLPGAVGLPDGSHLIVTPLSNQIQQMVRLETLDRVESIDDYRARLALAPGGC